ncbi:hypothetical protein [Legionella feeleii]|uniref:Uncharacterized protein n=2 Tax=Legionella feeleii TaxID=453 RepID=A0A378IU85_9GAMM|nr:hypothetical protein [Legionella feeleii]STX38788.1 Uncharacterised protein [Legionella feeleii]
MPSKSPLSTKASDFLNQITQLKEIIPAGGDLSTRLLRGCYKRVLSDLEGIITAEDEPVKLATRLKGYLSDHWDLIKGTSLSYTSIPEDRLTGLLVDIASFVAETIEGSEDEPLYPLTVLMPTVAVESLVDDKDYPSLNELALQEVLRTHILGKEGSYLVPVRQLIDLQEKPKNEWYNTYYDYKTPSKETALLSPEDYEQLGNHSSYTKALIEAKAQYELSLKEQGSLLYHLRELSSKLYFNSVLGVGIEENAGTGTYDAIIQFNDYYSKLDEVSKEKIPPAVKQEIDLLLTLSSDSTKNIKATSQIETCIKIRRESLVAAITPQEQVLSEIGLTEKTAKTLTDEKKALFISCQDELKKAIEEKKYQGNDKRGLTLELVKALNIDITISSAADLQEIVKLSHSELDSLFKEAALQKQFVDQFESLEELVLFIHQTPIPKLQVLLNHCGQSLANKFIIKPSDLSVLLISLDAERVSLIISIMGGKVKTADNFIYLLSVLSPEQGLAACKAIKEKLPEIIKSAFGLRLILEPLSLEQRAIVFEAVKEKLPQLFKKAYDFRLVFECLSPSQQGEIFQATKNSLPKIVVTIEDLKAIVGFLSAEHRGALIEAIKSKLPQMINSASDLSDTLKFLSLEECRIMLYYVKCRFPDIFIRGWQVKEAFDHSLSSDKLAVLFDAVKDYLPRIIDSSWFSFGNVLSCLNLEQSLVFLESVKDRVPEFFESTHYLEPLLKEASPEQCSALCNLMGKKPRRWARDINECCELLAGLGDPKIIAVLTNIPHFHQLIANTDRDFLRISGLLKTAEGKTKCHQIYFNSLLVDIKASGNSQDEAFDRLCETLRNQATSYFTGQTDIVAFKEACQLSVEEAKAHLRGQEPVLNLLGKWMLAIFTLGVAVACSSLNTKIQTGEWTCNFFKAPGEVEAEKLKDIVTKEFKP